MTRHDEALPPQTSWPAEVLSRSDGLRLPLYISIIATYVSLCLLCIIIATYDKLLKMRCCSGLWRGKYLVFVGKILLIVHSSLRVKQQQLCPHTHVLRFAFTSGNILVRQIWQTIVLLPNSPTIFLLYSIVEAHYHIGTNKK